LPGLDGWEVASALRQTGERGPKITMVSANVEDYRAGGQAGCPHDAFLVKPLDIQQMLDTIKSQTQIEWIYEVPAGEAVEASPHVVPPGIDRHLDELLQLGRISYARGIEAKLKEWEAVEPEAEAFIARLRTMVREFELKKYVEVLGAIQRHEWGAETPRQNPCRR
jgi:CheY-like chemotaxis protein